MAEVGFVSRGGNFPQTGAFDGLGLHLVVEQGGCSVGYHTGQEVFPFRRNHFPDGTGHPVSGRDGSAYVVGVVVQAAVHDTPSIGLSVIFYKDQGGGAMYDLGCYCTTMILSLVDSKPAFVKAVAEFSDLGVDYNTAAIIRFENGVRAAFNVGMILGENTNSRFDRLYIHGDKGSIRSDVEYNQAGEVSYKIYTKDEVIERKISVPQNYSLEITQLGNCILNGEKPLCIAGVFGEKFRTDG